MKYKFASQGQVTNDVKWLLRNDPGFARFAHSKGLAGLGNLAAAAAKTAQAKTSTSFLTTLTDSLGKAAQAYLTVKGQKDILKLQAKRAQQGLPPLDSSYYTPGMRVDVAPDFASGLGISKQTLLLGVAGVLGLILVMRLKKSK